MADKRINQFTPKTELDTDDEMVIQDSAGNTLKTTHENLLKTSGDVVVYRGTTKELEVGEELFEVISSGIYEFAGLAKNGDTSKFDIGAATGHIVDFDTDTYTSINYAGATAITPTVSTGVNYIYINSAGSIVQTSIPSSETTRRDFIYLGRVITISGVVVQVQDEPVTVLNSNNQIYDLAKAIRIFNIEGNVVSPNGSNLKIDKSAGAIFSIGANFTTNKKIPHRVEISAGSPQSFSYITQTAGSTEASTTDTTGAFYDLAGTKTAMTGSNNKSTLQKIYLFPSGAIRIAYGQVVYSTLAEAIQGASTEAFTTNPSIPGNGVLISILAIEAGCSDLSDPNQARLLIASRFGEGSTGGAGQSVSNCQNVYDNSATEPEVQVTDTPNGAMTWKDTDTHVERDNIIEVKDTDDNIVFGVRWDSFEDNPKSILTSGTYTPTHSNLVNLDSTTAIKCFYTRIGNIVTVTGQYSADPTANTTLTTFDIDLPIDPTANFSLFIDATGLGTHFGTIINVYSIPSSKTARLSWTSSVTTTKGGQFTFMYEID